MAEMGDDRGDNLAVAVLADEHMAAGATIAKRNHQLLRVPEGENDIAAVAIVAVERLMPAGLQAQCAREQTDDQRGDGGKSGEFQPSPPGLSKIGHPSRPL